MKRWIENLGDLTWPEAGEVFSREPVAILPIGATEPHGPHLPLDTDVVIACEMARRAALKLRTRGMPAFVLPPLAYGTTEFAAGFPGAVSLTRETTTGIVRDIGVSLARQGVRRFAIADSHLEPEHLAALHDAVGQIEREVGTRPVFLDLTQAKWARTLTDEYRRGECHAGAYETSLMMAVEPESVREKERVDLPAVHIDLATKIREGAKTFREAGAEAAYFGDPASATPADGHETYEILSDMLVAAVLEAWPVVLKPAHPRKNGAPRPAEEKAPAKPNSAGAAP